MRGRLIFKMTAVVARLDTAATATAGGFDDVLQEVTFEDTNGDGIGEPLRKEDGPDYTTFPAQVETDRDEMQRMAGSGDVPDSAIALVVHMRDMERLGLTDATRPGGIAIQKGDRLVRILDRRGVAVREFAGPDKGGLYCTHVKPLDAWLGSRANLTYLAFSERPQGMV